MVAIDDVSVCEDGDADFDDAIAGGRGEAGGFEVDEGGPVLLNIMFNTLPP